MRKILDVIKIVFAVLLGYAAALSVLRLLVVFWLSELMYITDSILILALMFFVGAFGSGVVVSALFISLTRRRERKLICDVKTVVKKVSVGDYSAEIRPVKHDEELNGIVEKLNSFTEKLGEVAATKYDFINNFTHEFRTPITSIKGFSEMMLKDENVTEEEICKYGKIISAECERLKGLAETTAYLHSVDVKNSAVEKQEFDIKNEIEECVLQLHNEAQKKGVEITVKADSFKVVAARALARQLWLNLLSNSVKYTGNGGKVNVAGKATSNGYVLSVADNGDGISDEALNRIFEAYYREDSARPTKGVGLGLTIAKKIADLHGWKLRVTSEKGKGSTFEVIINENA